MDSSNLPQVRGRRFRKRWLFAVPLIAWLCCLGAAVYLFFPLNHAAAPLSIPDTGDPAGPTPGEQTTPDIETPPAPGSPAADGYLEEAQNRLGSCTASFHDYFVLEQVA